MRENPPKYGGADWTQDSYCVLGLRVNPGLKLKRDPGLRFYQFVGMTHGTLMSLARPRPNPYVPAIDLKFTAMFLTSLAGREVLPWSFSLVSTDPPIQYARVQHTADPDNSQ